jgi:hypothetical protein
MMMKPSQSKINQNEQNGRARVQEDKRTTQEGEPQPEHQVPEPPPVVRSISNKERGGSLERMPSLDLHLFQ